jgi:hypothetical protein
MRNMTKEQKEWKDSIDKKFRGYHVVALNEIDVGPVGVKIDAGKSYIIQTPPSGMDLSLTRIISLEGKAPPIDLVDKVITPEYAGTICFSQDELLFAGGHGWGENGYKILGDCGRFYHITLDKWEYY